MKNPKNNHRRTPAPRGRRPTASTARHRPTAIKLSHEQNGGNAHHDLLVLCFYPGMGPDDRTAA